MVSLPVVWQGGPRVAGPALGRVFGATRMHMCTCMCVCGLVSMWGCMWCVWGVSAGPMVHVYVVCMRCGACLPVGVVCVHVRVHAWCLWGVQVCVCMCIWCMCSVCVCIRVCWMCRCVYVYVVYAFICAWCLGFAGVCACVVCMCIHV